MQAGLSEIKAHDPPALRGVGSTSRRPRLRESNGGQVVGMPVKII